MFQQIFLSPKVKRCTIITYKHGMFELPHELPNDIRLRKLGNTRKVPQLHENNSLVPIPHAKIQILLVLAKNSREIAIKQFP